MYDGKFNPMDDEAGEDPGYQRYKEIFVNYTYFQDVPKDAKIYEKFRKQAEQDKIK